MRFICVQTVMCVILAFHLQCNLLLTKIYPYGFIIVSGVHGDFNFPPMGMKKLKLKNCLLKMC